MFLVLNAFTLHHHSELSIASGSDIYVFVSVLVLVRLFLSLIKVSKKKGGARAGSHGLLFPVLYKPNLGYDGYLRALYCC